MQLSRPWLWVFDCSMFADINCDKIPPPFDLSLLYMPWRPKLSPSTLLLLASGESGLYVIADMSVTGWLLLKQLGYARCALFSLVCAVIMLVPLLNDLSDFTLGTYDGYTYTPTNYPTYDVIFFWLCTPPRDS